MALAQLLEMEMVSSTESSPERNHSFCTYAKFSEKLTFFTLYPLHTRTCAYQGVINVSFSGNFAYALNK